MKKLLLLLICYLIFSTYSVNASSITYNLHIDNNMKFHEKIIYNVANNEIVSTGKYDFLTSVVNGNVYFDNDESVLYTKTKSKTANGYVVTLVHDYSHVFFPNSRIAKECFTDIKMTNYSDGLSFSSTAPFYCSHRADSITVNISSDLAITGSNANSHNNNVYTWNNLDEDFHLRLSTEPASYESNPMDHIDDEEEDTKKGESDKKDNDTIKAKHIFQIIIFVMAGVLIVLALVLKKKSASVDKM